MADFPSDHIPSSPGLPSAQRKLPLGEVQGRLKIFLGYAPGVGTTYALLQAGHQLRLAGVDVAVGTVQTYGWPETQALLSGLARLSVSAASSPINPEQMDMDAVLSRHPQVVLIDRLAHSNAPGSRHPRRFQDVDELLAAGIDVFTTLNIQQVESLNDVVAQITGVTEAETVPDRILADADSIHLIDCPPQELLQRLKTGRRGGFDNGGLGPFYRMGNLIALRQLALRHVAEQVDEEMRAYMQDRAIHGPWGASERLLICVSPSPLSERLVRSGYRLASRLGASWFAVYVETSAHLRLSSQEKEQVARTLHLAESLGAKVVTLPGPTTAQAIVDYARAHNVTKIVAGKPLRPRWKDLLRGSVVEQIIDAGQEIDVYVINSAGEVHAPQQPPEGSKSWAWRSYLWGAGLVAFISLVSVPIHLFLDPTNLVMLYLLAMVIAGLRLGRGPSIVTAILSVLAFDVFFVPPRFTLAVADAQYLFTFGGLLGVGVVVSTLAAQARDQATFARQREAQTAASFELSRDLASADTMEAIAQSLVTHVGSTFVYEVAVLLPERGNLQTYRASPAFAITAEEQTAAQWAFAHGAASGFDTDTLPALPARFLPLITTKAPLGILAVRLPANLSQLPPPLTPEQRRLIETFASQAALAMERVLLAEKASQAQFLAAKEQMQTALLNSISHDLRTPLATITGALSSLLDDEAVLDVASRRDLTATAWEESERMNRLVGNLLDMTRLEAGALNMAQDPCDVQDLIGVSISRLGRRFQDRPVYLDIEDDLPLIPGDFVLLVQVLANLLDNAVKYSDSTTPIDLSAYLAHDPSSAAGAVEIAVADRGRGIPTDKLEAVFDKFYRVNPNLNTTGTGLGLSICRGIVEAHGGKIWAQNRAGGGVVVVVRLPLESPSESNPTQSMKKEAVE